MSKKLAIIGGGLWGGLLAYRLHELRPEVDFTLYERGDVLGGQHTWSFHGSDLDEKARSWIAPFITRSWDGQEVRFPQRQRRLKTSYHAIRSEQFNSILQKVLPAKRLRLESPLDAREFSTLGDIIIDARGMSASKRKGYQKFLGMDLKLSSPHGLKFPIIMDAQVAQLDGYRFIYILPWDESSLMIEDTRYSLKETLDVQEIERDLLEEVEKRGWTITSILRREVGNLPIPLSPVKVPNNSHICLSGIFHDTTGYSLPHAVKLIDRLVNLESFEQQAIHECVQSYRQEVESSREFFRMINLLLFQSSAPHNRYRMLQYFYGLPEALIERFYAGELGLSDKFRFFLGRPPVSILSAAQLLIQGAKK